MTGVKNKREKYVVHEWMPIFRSRANADGQSEFDWCFGSLEPDASSSRHCLLCDQDTSIFTEKDGVPKGLLQPHTRKYVSKGIYLIRVGAVDGQGDCIKIGSSNNMQTRLFDHFSSKRHQMCKVIFLTERSSNSKTTEAVEGLIVGRIREEFPNDQLEKYEEYFFHSNEIVLRIIELMKNPKILLPDLPN